MSPDPRSKLEAALTAYGREQLGCDGISPIWLSYYVTGCRQELHADVPHGPWAFVLSLTPPSRAFTGGETMLLQPHVLDYFRDFSAGAVVESAQLLDLVAPEFNRLTVFDARVPHGVRVVEGVADPRKARVVLHGWFLPATPFFEGGLTEATAADAVNDALGPLYDELDGLHPVRRASKRPAARACARADMAHPRRQRACSPCASPCAARTAA